MGAFPEPRLVYRQLGARQRIGAGIMDKAGIAVDQRERREGTWSLILVGRGHGRYLAGDGRAWDLRPGCCFMRVPGVEQSTYLHPDSAWLEGFVDLGPALWAALAAARVLRDDPPVWTWDRDPARDRKSVV